MYPPPHMCAHRWTPDLFSVWLLSYVHTFDIEVTLPSFPPPFFFFFLPSFPLFFCPDPLFFCPDLTHVHTQQGEEIVDQDLAFSPPVFLFYFLFSIFIGCLIFRMSIRNRVRR